MAMRFLQVAATLLAALIWITPGGGSVALAHGGGHGGGGGGFGGGHGGFGGGGFHGGGFHGGGFRSGGFYGGGMRSGGFVPNSAFHSLNGNSFAHTARPSFSRGLATGSNLSRGLASHGLNHTAANSAFMSRHFANTSLSNGATSRNLALTHNNWNHNGNNWNNGAWRNHNHGGYPFYGFGFPFFFFYPWFGYGLGWGGYGGYGYGYGNYGYGNYGYGNYPTYVVAQQAPATQTEAAGDYAAAGETAFRAANYPQAVRDWQHALVENPNSGGLMLLMAQALFASGQFEPAAGAVQMAMQMLPQDQWGTVVSHYTELYPDIGKYTEQLRALEKARTDNPENPALRFLLGYHYGYLGYPKNAVEELDKGIALQPKDAGAVAMRNVFAKQAGLPLTPEAPPTTGTTDTTTAPTTATPTTATPTTATPTTATPTTAAPAAAGSATTGSATKESETTTPATTAGK